MSSHAPIVTADFIVDNIADALIAVTVDGAIIFWNRAAEHMFGFSGKEAMGRSIVDLIVPNELRDGERHRIADTATVGAATFESVRARRDGTTIYVDISMQGQTSDDRQRYITICMKDVTRLKYLREAAVIEAQFRGLLEATRW
ncbi:MAG: PAS domain S-box protein [bacterium]